MPESWVWCRLGEICDYGVCNNVASSEIPNNAWVLDLEDIERDTAKLLQRVKKNDRNTTSVRHSFIKGNVLYSKLRTYLNKVLVADADGFCTTEILPLDFKGFVLSEYARHVLMSKMFLDYTAQCGYGVKMPRLGTTDGKSALFPLPPLSEQHRIVSVIESAFALIDEIETDKQSLEQFIHQTKSKVLDLAIRGKLVPQDPNDELTSVLLERVRSEQNATKSSAGNLHYNQPFEIPSSWAWCRLGEIVNVISGVSYNKNDVTPIGIRIIRGGNIQNNQILLLEDDVYIREEYKNDVNTIRKGDIVIVASTGSHLLIGKAGFATNNIENTQIGAFLRIIRPKINLTNSYFKYIFESDFYREYIRTFAKGTNINNIKNEYITEFFIPFPPLAEQRRIVSKINETFAQLDAIEKALKA